ncbi:MAG: hypothetical protein EH225_02280 [Calditrichaeota bacterium]|nr:MAG: hypothetical protein EH225_02280 [Calditrichota bacterium]
MKKQDLNEYVVIIGDISGSKRLNGMDRYQTQLFLKSALVQINEEFDNFLEAPATITKGDEFQALIDKPDHAYHIIQILQKMVFPISIRYGIGIGPIYRMGGKLPIEMDGPAFHRANHALTQAKKHKSYIWFRSGESSTDTLLNTIFLLISSIKSKWNERHFQLYWDYLELGTYKKVAAKKNVSPQAICDVLKNNRAVDVLEAEQTVLKFLCKFRKDPAIVS